MANGKLATYDELIAYLKEANVPHKAEPSQLALELPAGATADSGTVYVRWEASLPYVQVVFPFLADVPDDRVVAVEGALARVNMAVKLPGFGYNYRHKFVYMRLCVQLYEDGITPLSFQRQIMACVQNGKELAGAFKDVVAGAPPENVLELAVKHSTPS